MKSTKAFLFSLLYLMAMFRPVAPLFEYIVHEDYIAEFLCVNKDRKALNCNGKCYLMERLAEEGKDKKENLPKIAMDEYPIGFVALTGLQIVPNLLEYHTENNGYANHYLFLFSKGTFHPPNNIC